MSERDVLGVAGRVGRLVPRPFSSVRRPTDGRRGGLGGDGRSANGGVGRKGPAIGRLRVVLELLRGTEDGRRAGRCRGSSVGRDR